MKIYKELFISLIELEKSDVLTVSLEGDGNGNYEGEYGDAWD